MLPVDNPYLWQCGLFHNPEKRVLAACHAGRDPASSNERFQKTGFRVKPGMTKQQYT